MKSTDAWAFRETIESKKDWSQSDRAQQSEQEEMDIPLSRVRLFFLLEWTQQ